MKKQLSIFLISLLSLNSLFTVSSKFLSFSPPMDINVYESNTNPNVKNERIINENSNNKTLNIKKSLNSNNKIVNSLINTSSIDTSDSDSNKVKPDNYSGNSNEKEIMNKYNSSNNIDTQPSINEDQQAENMHLFDGELIDASIEAEGIPSNNRKGKHRRSKNYSDLLPIKNIHLTHSHKFPENLPRVENDNYSNDSDRGIEQDKQLNEVVIETPAKEINIKESDNLNSNSFDYIIARNLIAKDKTEKSSLETSDNNNLNQTQITNIQKELVQNQKYDSNKDKLTVINHYFINDKSTTLKSPVNPKVLNFYDKKPVNIIFPETNKKQNEKLKEEILLKTENVHAVSDSISTQMTINDNSNSFNIINKDKSLEDNSKLSSNVSLSNETVNDEGDSTNYEATSQVSPTPNLSPNNEDIQISNEYYLDNKMSYIDPIIVKPKENNNLDKNERDYIASPMSQIKNENISTSAINTLTLNESSIRIPILNQNGVKETDQFSNPYEHIGLSHISSIVPKDSNEYLIMQSRKKALGDAIKPNSDIFKFKSFSELSQLNSLSKDLRNSLQSESKDNEDFYYVPINPQKAKLSKQKKKLDFNLSEDDVSFLSLREKKTIYNEKFNEKSSLLGLLGSN